MGKNDDRGGTDGPDFTLDNAGGGAPAENPQVLKMGHATGGGGSPQMGRRAFLKGGLTFGAGLGGITTVAGCGGAAGGDGDQSTYYQIRYTALEFSDDQRSDDVQSVAFFPDGSKLVASGYDGPESGGTLVPAIKVWDLDTETELWSLTNSGQKVALSPDGSKVATTNGLILDADTGTTLTESVEANGREIYDSVAFSPDGASIVSYSASPYQNASIVIWDATDGRIINSWQGCHDEDSSIAIFSPDGQRIASNCNEKVIVWDLNGNEILTYNGHDKWLTKAICFSPDGTSIASGGIDAEVHVWDVETGALITKFEGHQQTLSSANASVNCVAFSPDGRTLASAGYDSTVVDMGNSRVHLFDPATGELILSYLGHATHIQAVAFNHDGTMLASGGRDGTVHVWSADQAALSVTCTCDAHDICNCNTVSGGGGGGHYWYPN